MRSFPPARRQVTHDPQEAEAEHRKEARARVSRFPPVMGRREPQNTYFNPN